jgi:hypothetical protein
MAQDNWFSESVWDRASKDTENFRNSNRWWFWGVDVLGSATLAGLTTTFIINTLPNWLVGVLTFFAFVFGMAIIYGFIYLWNLFRAPYRQRNELRKLVESQKKPFDSEIAETIQLLQAETLILKKDNEEKNPYSFAEVFLSIADELSVGISLNSLESRIIEGLQLDDSKGWYFPHKDKGVAHLIGVLIQNTLIDRHDVEYQRMDKHPYTVGEFIESGGLSMGERYLSKGMESRYYLSSRGSEIVKRLRQQLTVHKGGSQT